jgi:microcystin-dependent protein
MGPMGTVYDTDQIGTIKAWSGAAIPTNWMLADGSPLSRTNYAALYAALGSASSPWGQGDGSTTFNIPDLRSRMIVGSGAGPGLTNRALAARGGEETHILTIGEMCTHDHGAVTGGGTTGGGTTGGGTTGLVSNDHTHTFSGTTATENQGFNFNYSGTTSDVSQWNGVQGYNVWSCTGGANFVAITWGATLVGGDNRKYNDFAHQHTYSGTTATQNQNHNHNYSGTTSGISANHSHSVPGLSVPGLSIPGLSISAQGGGGAHNNMPPFVAVAMIVKVTGVQVDSGGAIQGATGQRGAIWYIYNGAGTPPPNTFVGELDGDWAIRKSDGENFQRVSGAWVDQGFTNRSTATTTSARAYRTAALTLTSQAWQAVPLDTVEYDSGSNWNTSTGKFVCPTAGYYLCAGMAGSTPGTAPGMLVGIQKNATTPLVRGSAPAAIGSPLGITSGPVAAVVQCNAGDTLALACYPSAADPLYLGSGGAFLSVTLVTAGPGPQGQRGANWWTYAGAGTPPANTFPTALTNDLCVRTSDGEVFMFTSGAWADQGWTVKAGIGQTTTAARMYRNTAFTPLVGWNKIAVDTVTYDVSGNLASVPNGRLNVPTAGAYQVNAQVAWSATSATVSCIVALYKNGTEYSRGQQLNVTGNGSNGRGQTVGDVIQCAAGDYIELYVYVSVNFGLEIYVTENFLSAALITAGPGPQGQRGSNWFTYAGAGTPVAGTFVGELDGDLCVRSSDGEVFKRTAGTWGDQGWKVSSTPVTMDAWHWVGAAGEPAFQNSWVNYSARASWEQCSFRKYPDGKVRLRGLISTGAAATTIFQLPVGYRPPAPLIFACDTNSNAHVRVNVQTDGTINAANSSPSYLSLANIEFDTDSVTVMSSGPQGPKGDPGTASFSDQVFTFGPQNLAANMVLCNFTNLNGNQDIEYEVVLDLLVTGAAANFYCWLQPNASAANFTSFVENRVYFDTAIASNQLGTASITPYGFCAGHADWNTGGRMHARARVSALSISGQGAANVGRPSFHEHSFFPNGSSAYHMKAQGGTTWWDAGTNITSLQLVCATLAGQLITATATGRASLRILR